MVPLRVRHSFVHGAPPLPLGVLAILFLLAISLTPSAHGQDELRALWVDAFHSGYKTPAQTSQLVADARAGNFNAIFVQVRKRGDAYYDSTLEPKALDVSPASYDPLADLIAQAHAGPEPLQVHAWIVTYNIWNSELSAPPQPTHPLNLHPEWLTKNAAGDFWDGANYQFDPALPIVQQHTFDVIMDIVTRYPVDGLHFDYIRYSESGASANYNVWGYHPDAVARFNALYGRSGTPSASDADWLQFRRDQVTALVRKTWLSIMAEHPEVCVSAACITWGNAPFSATEASFAFTSAYSYVLQDWRDWMEEGILDLAIPMIYRRYDTAQEAQQYAAWAQRAKEFQYDRAAALGIGFYLNSIVDNLTQIGIARDPVPVTQLTGAGLVGFSYAVTNDTGTPRQTFLDALTDPATAEFFTPGQPPLFAQPVAVPPQPWKTDVTLGHLAGYARDGSNDMALDGALVTLSGPENRIFISDGTGFIGAVGLAPGDYLLRISHAGLPDLAQTITVAGGEVALADATLVPGDFVFGGITLLADPMRVIVSWRSKPGCSYAIEMSGDLQSWTALASGIPPPANTMNTFQDIPPPDSARRYYRVVETSS